MKIQTLLASSCLLMFFSPGMASSPFSSQDSSMRNSPVVGFDPQAAGPYDNAARHKAPQGEGWVAQGQGYEEQKGRGQGQQAGSNMPVSTNM